MKKKKYPVRVCDGFYGKEIKIAVPDRESPVLIAQDVFGEEEPMCQVLVYESEEDEHCLSIRLNDNGTIAEITLPTEWMSKIRPWSDCSAWLTRRDGSPVDWSGGHVLCYDCGESYPKDLLQCPTCGLRRQGV